MKDKVITTNDNRKWLVMNEIAFEGAEYLLVIGVTDDKSDVTEELKVVKKVNDNNQIQLVIENDEALLMRVCPLLEI